MFLIYALSHDVIPFLSTAFPSCFTVSLCDAPDSVLHGSILSLVTTPTLLTWLSANQGFIKSFPVPNIYMYKRIIPQYYSYLHDDAYECI